ncbi:MAG: dihydrolipoyllysine-residue acetyltransferase [Bdellovibrionaceae bacterium]|nr:dihydrolipoyllysine-residue acetyltransferase [Pseudobdellovibrionaceae bacterium]NUM60200.1 dihydrolipoyllysine-residue acetyltransferase [Pseudobdellovibrionaceae bacterium]
MAFDLKLPELGEGVTEGELIKWLVKPGDVLKPDQSVAEIMTDKATVEVPTSKAGTVKELKFKAGDVVKVDSTLLVLEENGVANSISTTKTVPSSAASTPTVGASTTMASSLSSSSVYSIKLPELGEGVTEGELVKWLVKVGDQIKADQGIAEIMTDKATVEVPSPKAGIITELKFKAGDVVKVDSQLATLQINSQNQPAISQATSHSSIQTPTKTATNMALSQNLSTGLSTSASFYPPVMESRVLATPATRRLAREMQIDINTLSGTGLAGRVTREDVMKQSSSNVKLTSEVSSLGTTVSIPKTSYQSTRAQEEERIPLKGIRKKIAENLQMAKHIIPHFTLMDEVDVTELVAWRESVKEAAEQAGTKITYLPFVMKALISTIREFPMFNASIDDAKQEIVYKKYFNIGFAADTPNGLVVPVIKNADQKNIVEISKEILDLSKRARDGKLKPDEMKGATITITNIGSVGGTYATPIINHPEVAILGMYKIQDRLFLDNKGAVKNQKIMNYTITADHRLIDGAVAARFLKAFLGRIQKPSVMMLEMQ